MRKGQETTEEKKRKITQTLRIARILLFVGVPLILISPYIFTRAAIWESFSFRDTGTIGDTIGGITAPFVNLLGAILVFYALKAQVKANELLQDQIDNENLKKESDNATENLNQLYNHLNESINNFKFQCLASGYVPDEENVIHNECAGATGFDKMFLQIKCNFHGTEEDLLKDPCVSELYSILSIMNLLLDKLQTTKSNNKEILQILVKHQFDYKIMTRIRDENKEDLQVAYCESCERDHGIPSKILDLIEMIKSKF